MRVLFWIWLLSVMGTSAGAQSLVEVSKKEKKRRATIDKPSSDVKVYTNQDINDGDEDEPEASSDAAAAPAKAESSLESWRDAKAADMKAWRERKAEYQRRYNVKKNLLAELHQVKSMCERDAMPVASTEQLGMRQAQVSWGVGHVTCESVPTYIADTTKAIRGIEVECSTDARKHFIPAQEAKLAK